MHHSEPVPFGLDDQAVETFAFAMTQPDCIQGCLYAFVKLLFACGNRGPIISKFGRNKRGRKWNGAALGSLPKMLDELPTQFNEATTRTIELIDVLWLAGNSIVAAFEVESATSIYSGLLRMSDLIALQPNLDINLYLVAPDERRDKVEQELLRPTFSLREKPVAKICGFLAFSTLCEKLDGIRKLGLCGSLKPSFLKATADFFADEAGA